MTCSTSDATDAPADVAPVLTLPILGEIDTTVTVGTSGSSLTAVQAAVKLLTWGASTGLDTSEISDAATTWLSARNDNLEEFLQKLSLVDDACQKLMTDEAQAMMDSAGCGDTAITWGNQPLDTVEAIMQAQACGKNPKSAAHNARPRRFSLSPIDRRRFCVYNPQYITGNVQYIAERMVCNGAEE